MPPTWRGVVLPVVVFSGHHAQLAGWGVDLALRRTAQRRPDLVDRLAPADLDERDRAVLEE
jgi:tRNA (guanine37-N1)-methyltransferase